MFKQLSAFLGVLVLAVAAPINASQASSDAVYLPTLGANATGTNISGKLGLDVNVISPINATNPSVSTTGSAVPAYGTYAAGNKAGNLTGLLIGQQTMANSLACVLPSDQAAIPVTESGTWTVQPGNTANTTPWLESISAGGNTAAVKPASTAAVATDSALVVAVSPNNTIGATQSGTWMVQPGNTANTTPWLSTISQGGNSAAVTVANALKVDGSAITQPISAASLPLPTGAATSAKQPALGTAGVSSADVITVQGIASMTALKVDGSAVTQPVSAASLPLPTGAATAALQAKWPINTTGSGTTGTVSTVITLTAPANAVGFILTNLDTSTANLRWALGRTATTAVGAQLQPGRDTGFVPAGASVSLVAESGTQNYDVAWVSQ